MVPDPKPTKLSPSASEIARDVKLSEEASQLLTPTATPEVYFDKLNQSGLYIDAVRFMVRSLPRPSAVWWACLCVWGTPRERQRPETDAVIKSVVHWLQQPTDAHRRAVDAASKTAETGSAIGMLGKAVFLAEGSISLIGLPEVKPDPKLLPNLITMCILSAARSNGAAKTQELLRQYLAIGVEVYRGKNSWHRKT